MNWNKTHDGHEPHNGDTVRDTVTGLQGTITGLTKWVSGCDTAHVQPPLDKDGKVPDSRLVDLPMLVLVQCNAQPNPTPGRGGPRSMPARQR